MSRKKNKVVKPEFSFLALNIHIDRLFLLYSMDDAVITKGNLLGLTRKMLAPQLFRQPGVDMEKISFVVPLFFKLNKTKHLE